MQKLFPGDASGFFQGLYTQYSLKKTASAVLSVSQRHAEPKPFGVYRRKKPADNDSPIEQAFIVRIGNLRADAHPAGRLSADRDVVRIPAKGRDVPLYPP